MSLASPSLQVAALRARRRRSLLLTGVITALILAGAMMEFVHPIYAVVLLAAAGGAGLLLWTEPLTPAETAIAPPPPPPRGRVEPAVSAVVAALPEPALLLTPDADILVANARVALAIGPAKVGDPLSFLVRVPEVLEAVRSSAQDGIPRRVEFGERIPLDRWLEAHIVPLRLAEAPAAAAPSGDGPKPDTVLLTFRDLTQQRRVEQMRADFVANASHELRTPLASLSGFIETLLGPARNDAAARERFLGIMGAQARRMSRLIDDLLSLSRIELNAHVRPDTQVELGMIVAHVCETLSPLARERGVEITVSRPETPVPILGDRDELIRLFENLVENALKYGASGKRIEVALTLADGDAVITVTDFGPGIPAEHLPRLTERFYRVDVVASRDQGGTGLGLAIVKHIVARHRGKLTIESQPGAGATFTTRIETLAAGEKKS
ncbi:MAG: ATP-binding protein [Pseudomonadota bacterium]